MNRRIKTARITPVSREMFDRIPEVYVTVDGMAEILLFHYYPGELSFQPAEFIGLTLPEALQLRQNKAYFQS